MDKTLAIRQEVTSSDGTIKYLLKLTDGNLIETVLMRHEYGNSVCVTSQAGCSMGCKFCASGLIRKIRNLTADELEGQINTVQKNVQEMITHIVVMGTGEPFDNYSEVIRFCDRISNPKQRENPVAPRHITVSTCGIVPGIYDFIHTDKRYQLAVSLHAPNNEIRNRLMPVNQKYPVQEVLTAAEFYCQKTGRRVAFEYLLLEGINDSMENAEELAVLLASFPKLEPYVNLIPYNKVGEFNFRGSSKEQALRFYDVLMKHKIKATLRKERGGDISAACGQLRLSQS